MPAQPSPACQHHHHGPGLAANPGAPRSLPPRAARPCRGAPRPAARSAFQEGAAEAWGGGRAGGAPLARSPEGGSCGTASPAAPAWRAAGGGCAQEEGRTAAGGGAGERGLAWALSSPRPGGALPSLGTRNPAGPPASERPPFEGRGSLVGRRPLQRREEAAAAAAAAAAARPDQSVAAAAPLIDHRESSCCPVRTPGEEQKHYRRLPGDGAGAGSQAAPCGAPAGACGGGRRAEPRGCRWGRGGTGCCDRHLGHPQRPQSHHHDVRGHPEHCDRHEGPRPPQSGGLPVSLPDVGSGKGSCQAAAGDGGPHPDAADPEGVGARLRLRHAPPHCR